MIKDAIENCSNSTPKSRTTERAVIMLSGMASAITTADRQPVMTKRYGEHNQNGLPKVVDEVQHQVVHLPGKVVDLCEC